MAERIVDDLELIEVEAMQREQRAVARRGAEVMLQLLLEHRAVGQARQLVVERELRDPLLALGDLADHLVEAVGKPREFVLAANANLDVLTRCQPPRSLVEPRERLRDPARRLPGRKPHQQKAKQRHQTQRKLQLACVGQRFSLWISKEQDRAVASGEGWQRLGESDRAVALDGHFERRGALDMRFDQPNLALLETGQASRGLGPTILVVHDHRRLQRDSGQALEPAHFLRIEIGREHDPADQRRRHDRRGHQLAGTPFENGNARDVPVIERVEQGRALVAGDRGANARDPTFRGHDEGASNAEPRCHVSKGGLHCRLVAAGYSSTKAEVAREQLSRILQLPRPLLPQPVVDRATRLELALDLA